MTDASVAVIDSLRKPMGYRAYLHHLPIGRGRQGIDGASHGGHVGLGVAVVAVNKPAAAGGAGLEGAKNWGARASRKSKTRSGSESVCRGGNSLTLKIWIRWAADTD